VHSLPRLLCLLRLSCVGTSRGPMRLGPAANPTMPCLLSRRLTPSVTGRTTARVPVRFPEPSSPCSNTSTVQGTSSVTRPCVMADRTQSTRTVAAPAGVLTERQIQHVANHSRAMGDFPEIRRVVAHVPLPAPALAVQWPIFSSCCRRRSVTRFQKREARDGIA